MRRAIRVAGARPERSAAPFYGFVHSDDDFSAGARQNSHQSRRARPVRGRIGVKPYEFIGRPLLRRRARRAAVRASCSMSALRCPGVPALLVGGADESGDRRLSAGGFATTLVADEGFLATSLYQGAPAARRLFAPACVETDCAHWRGGGCELLGRIAQLLAEAAAPVRPSPAYDCGIRQDCRWRRQRGDEACGICGFIAREPLEPCPDQLRMGSRSIPA